MKKCPNGHEVSNNVRFCPTCGANVVSGNHFCAKCGSERKGAEKFCSQCGTPYGQSSPNMMKNNSKSNKSVKMWILIAIIVGVIGLFILAMGGVAWYFFGYSNLTTIDNTTVDRVISKQEKLCDFNDIVEFQNLMQGCSGLTSQAKSNYQKAKHSIEAIAKRNDFTIYEYHYVNGDLGQGEMSSYCCYLYKNCTISKGEDGYPTFTPTYKGHGCVLSDGEITVYDKDSYDELVRWIKERCGNKLYSEAEGDGEDVHYYSDGKYCYYIDCIGSGEYRIPIRKQIDENDGTINTKDLSWLQGHWVYEQGSYKGHFIIQGDKIIQYSSMNPKPDEATFRIDNGAIRARLIDGMDLVVPIDFANYRIDYGDGCWMHKVSD